MKSIEEISKLMGEAWVERVREKYRHEYHQRKLEHVSLRQYEDVGIQNTYIYHCLLDNDKRRFPDWS